MQLLLESLEDGAKTTRAASHSVSLTRERLTVYLIFLAAEGMRARLETERGEPVRVKRDPR